MWLQKYAPTTVRDLVCPAAAREVSAWLQQYDSKQQQAKALLLHGPPGVGKSALISVVSREMGLHVTLIDHDMTSRQLRDIFTNRRIDGQSWLAVLDSADVCGSLAHFVTEVSAAKVPVMLLCNDRYANSLKPMLKFCLVVQVDRPTVRQISTILQAICKAEHFELWEQDVNEFAYPRDLRQAITQLEFSDKASPADRNATAFDTAHNILRAKPGDVDAKMRCVSVDRDMVELIVHENGLSGTKDVAAAARFAESMSSSDVFSRCNAEAAASACIAAASAGGASGFPKFPQYLGKTSSIGKRRRMLKDLRSAAERATPHSCCDTDSLRLLCSLLKVLVASRGQAEARKLARTYGITSKAMLVDAQVVGNVKTTGLRM